MKKIVLLAFVLVLLFTTVVVGFVRPVVAHGTIYIRADGSVDPDTAPISSVDNITYTLTDNIVYDSWVQYAIVVERDSIAVDGARFTVQGTGIGGMGIRLSHRSNVTIRNMEIKGFQNGMGLSHSSNSNISENNITNNEIGIHLYDWSNNNTISGNEITNNSAGIRFSGGSSDNILIDNYVTNNDYGIFFLPYSSNNIIYHNNFVNNTHQVYTSNSVNVWDSGVEGNYWSDYEDRYPDADELDDSGIWDTPYVIDENNHDNCPLMNPWTPTDEEEEKVPFWMQWWLWAIIVLVIVALAGAVYFLKKRKPPTPTTPTLTAKGTDTIRLTDE